MHNQPHPFGSEPSHMPTKIQVKIITWILLIHIIPFSRKNVLVCNWLGESPWQQRIEPWTESPVSAVSLKNLEGIAICAVFICESVVCSWTRVWAPSSGEQQWPSYLQTPHAVLCTLSYRDHTVTSNQTVKLESRSAAGQQHPLTLSRHTVKWISPSAEVLPILQNAVAYSTEYRQLEHVWANPQQT